MDGNNRVGHSCEERHSFIEATSGRNEVVSVEVCVSCTSGDKQCADLQTSPPIVLPLKSAFEPTISYNVKLFQQ